MDKDIRQMMENIEVPMEKLDRAIMDGIKQSNVNPYKRRNKMVLISVAAIGLILCSGIVSPKIGNVLAEVPIIGFMYKIEENDPGLHVAMTDENKVTLNQTLESNGVALTVEDIVYDGTRIAFTYYQEEYDEIYPLTIRINGEEINFSENLRELEAETGFRGLIEISPEEALPESFDIEITIHQIGGTKGEWIINTTIEKVKNNSQSLEIGQKGMIEGNQFKVVQAEKSDTGTNLKVAFETSFDELFNIEKVIGVTVTDQNGVPIQMLNKHGNGSENESTYQYLLAPLAKEVTELHVLHYYIPSIDERVEIKEKLEEKLPQVISQGKMGDIVITKVQRLEDENVMTFHTTSEFLFDASFFPSVITVLDEQGNDLVTDYPKAIGRNEYELKFQEKSGDVWINTFELPIMKVEESAKIVIPVE